MTASAREMQCRVLLLGSGLTGLAFIHLLQNKVARCNLPAPDCIIVDRADDLGKRAMSADDGAADMATVALSRASVDILQQSGLWHELATNAAPLRRVIVSEANSSSTTTLDCRQADWDYLGQVVPMANLGKQLFDAVKQKNNNRFLFNSDIEKILPQSDGITVVLRSGSSHYRINTQLLAIADGAGSNTAATLGISYRSEDYRSEALLFNASIFNGPRSDEAHKRFLDNGSLALLPLVNLKEEQRVLIVRVGSAAVLDELQNMDSAMLAERLSLEAGNRHWQFSTFGKIRRKPLVMKIANEQFRRHTVLLGESAHALHPAAAQGYNLSLRDVHLLAEQLAAAATANSDCHFGDLALLENYAAMRKNDQRFVTALSHSLPLLFDSRRKSLVSSRRAAMGFLNYFSPARKWFTSRAAGF